MFSFVFLLVVFGMNSKVPVAAITNCGGWPCQGPMMSLYENDISSLEKVRRKAALTPPGLSTLDDPLAEGEWIAASTATER
jgi:hypothetical protein